MQDGGNDGSGVGRVPRTMLIGSLLALVGGPLIAFGATHAFQRRHEGWTELTATVVDVPPTGVAGTETSEFVFESRTWQVRRPASPKERVRESTVPIWFPPGDPGAAVPAPGVPPWFFSALLPLVLVVGGLGGVWSAWRGGPDERHALRIHVLATLRLRAAPGSPAHRVATALVTGMVTAAPIAFLAAISGAIPAERLRSITTSGGTVAGLAVAVALILAYSIVAERGLPVPPERSEPLADPPPGPPSAPLAPHPLRQWPYLLQGALAFAVGVGFTIGSATG